MWWFIGGGALVLVVGVVAFAVLRARKRNFTPLSVVMLRSRASNIDAATVRGAFRRAYGVEPSVEPMDLPDGGGKAFVAWSEGIPPLGVICSQVRYFDKAQLAEALAPIEHPEVRRAMSEHVAWVSVDAMGVDMSISKEETRRAQALLAKLAGELIDDGCMLLYLTRTCRVAENKPETEAMMRDGRLQELFGDDELHAPVIQVESDDAKIKAAMEEAKKRLPEFVLAFERLGERSHAMFKGRFGNEDDGEYIWLKLQSVEAKALVGTIENHPVNPSIPRKGSVARVAIEHVADWAYVDEKEQGQGLFVDSILLKRRR